MRGGLTLVLIGIAGWLWSAAPGSSAAPEPACTMDVMEAVPAAVIEPCTKAIENTATSPADRATAFYIRARGYGRTGRTALASQDYDVAIKLAPDKGEFYDHRANTEFRRGRYQAAYADLTKALALNPRDALAFRMLGTAYKDAGYDDHALELLSQSLSIDPIEPYALMTRSMIYFKQHRIDDAFKDADALVAIPPEVINRLGYIGADASLQDFHVVALTHRADLETAAGRLDAAAKDYDAAVQFHWSAEALSPRGGFLLTRPGRREDALKDLEEAARLNPADYVAQYDRGWVLLVDKRYDPALEAFAVAMKLRPLSGQPVLMHARTLRGLGRSEEATGELEHAMQIDAAICEETTRTFETAGYLPSGASHTAAELHAAAQACMIDETCN